MKIISIILGLSISLLLTGCFTTTFHRDGGTQSPDKMENVVSYTPGIFGSATPVDLKDTCGGRQWDMVRMEKSWFDWKIGVNCK